VRQELDPEHEHVVAQTYLKNERGDYVVSTVSLWAGPTVSLRGGAAMADEVAVVLARYETQVFTWSGWNSGRLTPKHEERHATIDEARYRHERVVDDVEAGRLP
jgi:predicted ATPase